MGPLRPPQPAPRRADLRGPPSDRNIGAAADVRGQNTWPDPDVGGRRLCSLAPVSYVHDADRKLGAAADVRSQNDRPGPDVGGRRLHSPAIAAAPYGSNAEYRGRLGNAERADGFRPVSHEGEEQLFSPAWGPETDAGRHRLRSPEPGRDAGYGGRHDMDTPGRLGRDYRHTPENSPDSNGGGDRLRSPARNPDVDVGRRSPDRPAVPHEGVWGRLTGPIEGFSTPSPGPMTVYSRLGFPIRRKKGAQRYKPVKDASVFRLAGPIRFCPWPGYETGWELRIASPDHRGRVSSLKHRGIARPSTNLCRHYFYFEVIYDWGWMDSRHQTRNPQVLASFL